MNENLSFMTFPSKRKIRASRKQTIETLAKALAQQDIQVFYLDGQEIYNKEIFLRKTAEAMKFPAYFGFNWDAFEECITDLTWCPAKEYVLIYERPDVFAHTDPSQWQIAIEILHSAEEYWGATDTPLNVFLLN